jgi:hypothetical protein
MSVKKPVDTLCAELRVLNSAVDETNVSSGLDWQTPEFWTMAGTALVNLLSVAALLGWISNTQAEELTKALTALIAATQVIVLNTALVWRYLNNRAQLRAQMMMARFDYMQAVAVERLRAERN